MFLIFNFKRGFQLKFNIKYNNSEKFFKMLYNYFILFKVN